MGNGEWGTASVIPSAARDLLFAGAHADASIWTRGRSYSSHRRCIPAARSERNAGDTDSADFAETTRERQCLHKKVVAAFCQWYQRCVSVISVPPGRCAAGTPLKAPRADPSSLRLRSAPRDDMPRVPHPSSAIPRSPFPEISSRSGRRSAAPSSLAAPERTSPAPRSRVTAIRRRSTSADRAV